MNTANTTSFCLKFLQPFLNKKMRAVFIFTNLFIFSLAAQQQNQISVGDPSLRDWKGIAKLKNNAVQIPVDNYISYRYPDGRSYNKGFRTMSENVSDWSSFSGLRFDIFQKDSPAVELELTLKVPDTDIKNLPALTSARTSISGKGWHTVYVNWNSFEISRAQLLGVLRNIKEISISAKNPDKKSEVYVKNIELVKAARTALLCDIKGKSAKSGQKAFYEIKVANTTDKKQAVQLSFQRYGWESMICSVTPSSMELNAGEQKNCVVEVSLPASLPEGTREKQVLQVRSAGMEDQSLTLITASSIDGPNILHTAGRWQEIRNNVKKYLWAEKAYKEYQDLADKWVVPKVASKPSSDNGGLGMHLFQTQEEFNLMASGISYQISGKKQYAEKIALFLRRLSDPHTGYPSTYRACHQSFVQEGHFFQHIVMAYDMIRFSGVLSPEDTQNIENTLRLYIETVDKGLGSGAINNWLLSEITGSIYAALALQDWDLTEKIFYGPQGIVDHLQQGVMSDGWWYECTISYNVWCASEFSQIALALEPWGLDFKNSRYPIGTSKYYSLMPQFKEPGLYGMNFEKWGTVTKNSIGIKDMWDALPSFTDYRGIMFGVNDAKENLISGQPYELAYYMYKDPEYASIIRRGDKRDLLYALGDLPETHSVLQTKSAYADNMGIVMLRSQKENRLINEQLQAALHYGTFGGYHGHFDRTNLLHLSRYGRSFYNPEMIWYGYPSFMYKFYVQTSMSKNMVVVDQKMQEPVESFKTLFHSGSFMQAAITETNARWSNPPYGGMVYDWASGADFAQKSLQENRSVPIPKNAPPYGAVTGFTEPVLQRRLMVMMDDYVVIADYLKAEKQHTFDWLFQMKGFTDLNADEKTFLRRDSQMNPDPLGSAQFVTDCSWWQAKGPAKASFSMCWGRDCDNTGTMAPYSEEGDLKINVTSVWPPIKEIMAGTAPEPLEVQKHLSYKIMADSKTIAQGETGAWILGQAEISTKLQDVKQLTLEVKSQESKNPNIFWGDAKILLQDGTELKVSDLPVKSINVKPLENKGKDYFGGPVKIAGKLYEDCMAAMPEQSDQPSEITLDLSGIKAAEFKAVLGCDFPLGEETARRKTYSVRADGKEVRFLNIIEPFEKQSVIKKAEAIDADHLKVTLTDGRIQEIAIQDFEAEKGRAQIWVKESKNGKLIRQEKTTNEKQNEKK